MDEPSALPPYIDEEHVKRSTNIRECPIQEENLHCSICGVVPLGPPNVLSEDLDNVYLIPVFTHKGCIQHLNLLELKSVHQMLQRFTVCEPCKDQHSHPSAPPLHCSICHNHIIHVKRDLIPSPLTSSLIASFLCSCPYEPCPWKGTISSYYRSHCSDHLYSSAFGQSHPIQHPPQSEPSAPPYDSYTAHDASESYSHEEEDSYQWEDHANPPSYPIPSQQENEHLEAHYYHSQEAHFGHEIPQDHVVSDISFQLQSFAPFQPLPPPPLIPSSNSDPVSSFFAAFASSSSSYTYPNQAPQDDSQFSSKKKSKKSEKHQRLSSQSIADGGSGSMPLEEVEQELIRILSTSTPKYEMESKALEKQFVSIHKETIKQITGRAIKNFCSRSEKFAIRPLDGKSGDASLIVVKDQHRPKVSSSRRATAPMSLTVEEAEEYLRRLLASLDPPELESRQLDEMFKELHGQFMKAICGKGITNVAGRSKSMRVKTTDKNGIVIALQDQSHISRKEKAEYNDFWDLPEQEPPPEAAEAEYVSRFSQSGVYAALAIEEKPKPSSSAPSQKLVAKVEKQLVDILAAEPAFYLDKVSLNNKYTALHGKSVKSVTGASIFTILRENPKFQLQMDSKGDTHITLAKACRPSLNGSVKNPFAVPDLPLTASSSERTFEPPVGLIQWLGQRRKETGPFVTPSQFVSISSSDLLHGSAYDILNDGTAQGAVLQTVELSDAFIELELKECFQLSRIGMAHPGPAVDLVRDNYLRNWRVDGWNEAKQTWETLINGSQASSQLSKPGQYLTWKVNTPFGCADRHKRFVLRLTGPNSSGKQSIVLARIEFYGTLFSAES